MAPADEHLNKRLDRIEAGQDALLGGFSEFKGEVRAWMESQGKAITAVDKRVGAHLQEHADNVFADLKEARKAPADRLSLIASLLAGLGAAWAAWKASGVSHGP